ncbi:hypothetical protein DLAC_09371 [Tieghemostelium lacteum]|uniref:Uncharacterized protein n=1 Tax=Tieghemostelium lacteum TaxID=361077 RepID=A0A151ZA34_TIELA|nr:hypothetical protein DLAC_09371 [Tieghemostelium lacteum]|eukprot:KYQ90734.1 hypothetical protein DLAC_09371 [Tieghemostelium lacteum]
MKIKYHNYNYCLNFSHYIEEFEHQKLLTEPIEIRPDVYFDQKHSDLIYGSQPSQPKPTPTMNVVSRIKSPPPLVLGADNVPIKRGPGRPKKIYPNGEKPGSNKSTGGRRRGKPNLDKPGNSLSSSVQNTPVVNGVSSVSQDDESSSFSEDESEISDDEESLHNGQSNNTSIDQSNININNSTNSITKNNYQNIENSNNEQITTTTTPQLHPTNGNTDTMLQSSNGSINPPQKRKYTKTSLTQYDFDQIKNANNRRRAPIPDDQLNLNLIPKRKYKTHGSSNEQSKSNPNSDSELESPSPTDTPTNGSLSHSQQLNLTPINEHVFSKTDNDSQQPSKKLKYTLPPIMVPQSTPSTTDQPMFVKRGPGRPPKKK